MAKWLTKNGHVNSLACPAGSCTIKGRLRQFLELTYDGILLVRPDGEILFANSRTEHLFGYTREELQRRRFDDLIPQAFRKPHRHWQAYGENPRLRPVGTGIQAFGLRKDGAKFPLDVSLTAIHGEEPLVVVMAREETERQRAEEDHYMLASIVKSSKDAIVSKSPDGTILTWNPGAEALYGYAASEMLGKNIEVLVPPQRLGELHEIMRRLKRGEGLQQFETQRVHKDGRLIDVSQTISPIHDRKGRYVAASSITRDISDRKRIERLEQQRQELMRSNAELEQFAYVASHDLQEPLRMVTNFVQLLSKRYNGRLDPEADEFIRFAVNGAERMRTLIGDLLTYSRTGRGQPLAPVQSGRCLEQALANLFLAIQESGARITRDPLPAVMADYSQLCCLFQNLIENALKFRSEQTPEIHISAQAVEGEWLFCVRDNGIGIDPQYHERIFMIFQRLHSRDEYPGTGLGLALCKRIVESHGGRIWVQSRPGPGSSFCFTFAAAMQEALHSGK